MTVRPPGAALNVAPQNPEEDAYMFLRATVQQAIDAGLLRAELNDADQVAQMAWASVHGAISLHMCKCTASWIEMRPLAKLAEDIIDALVRGIRKEAA
jgi:hypothetical protein